jgi:septal ring factor EnvC (AmiA/AmiB activator)
MQNNKFKTPLLQSAAVLGAVIVLVLIVGSSGSSSAGGSVVTLFSAIGNGILFAIGMAIAVALSITILIGIFLAAVAMVDSNEAAKMYAGLKKNFAASLLALSCSSCNENNATIGVSEEEYAAMKEELAQLQTKNKQLHTSLDSVMVGNTEMQNNVSSLDADNTVLKAKVDELLTTVDDLRKSEAKINEMVAQLSAKLKESNDKELKDQINALEQLQTSTKTELETIGARLTEVETKLKKAPTPTRTTKARAKKK